jgi:sensor domain CHASE-containing protein
MKTLTEIIKGMPKEVLEYLESNTELAKTAISSHRKEFRFNVLYILIGFVLSLIPTIFIQVNSAKESQRLHELIDRIAVNKDPSKDFQQLQLEINALRTEIDSLKKSKNKVSI